MDVVKMMKLLGPLEEELVRLMRKIGTKPSAAAGTHPAAPPSSPPVIGLLRLLLLISACRDPAVTCPSAGTPLTLSSCAALALSGLGCGCVTVRACAQWKCRRWSRTMRAWWSSRWVVWTPTPYATTATHAQQTHVKRVDRWPLTGSVCGLCGGAGADSSHGLASAGLDAALARGRLDPGPDQGSDPVDWRRGVVERERRGGRGWRRRPAEAMEAPEGRRTPWPSSPFLSPSLPSH